MLWLEFTNELYVLIAIAIVLHSAIGYFLHKNLPQTLKGKTAFNPVASVSEFVSILLILVIAVGLRSYQLNRGLNYDEIFSAMAFIETDSLWLTISRFIEFNNHIAYSLLARLSQSLLGKSEWALRLPAFVMGIACVYYLWIFVRRQTGAKEALAAAFMFALAPSHVIWSESARGYTGLVLFTLMSIALYWRLMESPSRRDKFIFILVSALAAYFHLYALFVTIVQFLFLLLSGFLTVKSLNKHSSFYIAAQAFNVLWKSFLWIGILVFILYLPVLELMLKNLHVRGHGQFIADFPFQVIGMLSGDLGMGACVGVFLVFLLGVVSICQSNLRNGIFYILLLIVPLMAVWFARPHFLFPRFFVYYLPYYVMITAVGFFYLWNKFIGRNAFLFRCALSIVAILISFGWAANSIYKFSDEKFKEAVLAMEENVPASTLFCALGGGAELFQYYSTKDIFIPYSQSDYNKIVGAGMEVRCVYRQRSWELPLHTQLGKFLSNNSQEQEFKGIRVFRYKK